jgi:predicted ArsR family transcriptional regulator
MDSGFAALDDDVLAQPTRARLFRLLRELRRPATTEELAAELGLHRSGVRVHLERLQGAGLVERHRARQPRGRPRDAWSLSVRAEAAARRPEAYTELAGWLASAVPARPGRLREVEAAGRRLGRGLAGGGADVPLEQRVEAVFAALGFQPRSRSQAEGAVCFELCNCPYRAAVRANQPVVCTLHRGLTEGLLDVVAPRAALRAFVPKDPDRAGCLVEIEAGSSPVHRSQENTG